MSKKCAKCEKTVYPTEEFRCLDKCWHRACFRCWECGMTLNMKNYKGYEKKPYCVAHYPILKSTAVVDTPEMARLAQNTKNQSSLIYHAEFEKAKGKYTSVTDDPETIRAMQNQNKISGVKYHEEFEKNIKGTKLNVTDEPELQRLKKNQANVSQIEYRGSAQTRQEMESHRGNLGGAGDFRPRIPSQEHQPSPYSGKNVGNSTSYSSGGGKVEQQAKRGKVGSIADYDPMADKWGSLNTGYAPPSGQLNQRQDWEETVQVQQPKAPEPQQQPAHYPVPQPQQPPAPAPAPAAPAKPTGPVFKAMYDYEAQDDDEVGFHDGDMIVDIEPIDEGWMFGTVQRSGKRGMLPANYVERQ